MSAIGGTWYVSDSMGFAERIDNVPVDYYRYVYATQPDGRKFIVAKAYSGDDSDYEGTARLIASAPKLLVALRLARDDLSDLLEVADLTDEGVADTTEVLNKVIAAIAKAEGRDTQCAPTGG